MVEIGELRRLLSYDPETGVLKWQRRHPSAGHVRRWNARYAGKPALSSLDSSGYLHGSLSGRFYLAHRVAYAIFHGKMPDGQIDHINGDRSDNRIENLRDVPGSENAKNLGFPKHNTSGFVGVSFSRAQRKWVARIGSVHLGTFSRKIEAIEARRAAILSHGYHENHGKRRIEATQ